MIHTICVKPFDAGWSVACDGADNSMLFLSGAKAEAAARALARNVAQAGKPAAIEIWLRDGRLAGRFVCAPGQPQARRLS
jgi:hypothetical protein